MADVLRQENSIVQNKFFGTLKKFAFGKNIKHSLKYKLLELVTAVTVKPEIAVLKHMSQWYQKKGVPQNEMAVCLIVEHQMTPLQLKLNTAPLQNMKAHKLKVMQNKSYHTGMEKRKSKRKAYGFLC